MSVTVFSGVDQVEQAVGSHLGYSDWHTVTQQQIDAFAEVTGDDEWIHVDPVRAAAGPYGCTIAHGFLTLSLVSKFLCEVYSVAGMSLGVNYGANKLRFPGPVPVNSRIRAGFACLSFTAGDRGYQLVVRATVEVEGQEKPACVVDMVSLFVP